MKVKDVRNSQDSSCSESWAAEGWNMGDEGKQQKEMKKQWGKKKFLTFFVRTEGGHRGNLCTHSKNIGAKISELNQGDSPANSGQAGEQTFSTSFNCHPPPWEPPSSPSLEEKVLSLLSSPFAGEAPGCGKGCRRCCRIGVPAQQNSWCSLGEPRAGCPSLLERCGQPECDADVWSSFLGLGATNFRHLYCLNWSQISK